MLSILIALCGAPAPQGPFTLHPADASVVVQIPDVQGALAAYATTVYGRILADPDLHAALGRVSGSPEPLDPRDLLAGQVEAFFAGGDVPPLDALVESARSLSFSLSVPGGDLGGFITGLMQSGAAEEDALAALSLRLVADFESPEAAARAVALLTGAAEREGQALARTEIAALGGGFGAAPAARLTLAGAAGSFERSMRIVMGGARVALFVGAEPDAVALPRAAGLSEEPTAAAGFQRARAGFPPAGGTVLFEARLQAFAQRLLGGSDPLLLPGLDLAEGLLGPLASMALRGGEWRVRIEDGQFVTDGTYKLPEAAELDGLFGVQPLDPRDLGLVQPDAILAWAVSLDKRVLLELVEGLAAQNGGEEMLAQFDAELGFRPDRDLIQPLGNALAYSMPTLSSLVSAPPFSLALDVEDLAAFTKGIDGVVRMIEEQMGDDVQIKREDYKGVRMYTLSFAAADDASSPFAGLPINPAAMFRPTIAIGQGRAFVITTPNLAKREIRRVEKLSDEPELHPSFTASSLPKGATEAGFADWGEFFGKLYSGVKGLAPMLGSLVGELPFDLSTLPDADVIVRHFKPSQRTKRIEGGTVWVNGRSSFGPEALLAIAGGAGYAFFDSADAVTAPAFESTRIPEPAPEPAPEPLPPGGAPPVPPAAGPETDKLLTQDLLLALKVELTVHRFDHGAYPATLTVLGRGDAKDGWGRAPVYKVTQSGFTLYSIGPNGIDDGGAGDDILPID